MTSSLEARVAAHCRRAALLPPGRPVLAMVSGGADSTCLMYVLARLHDGPVGVLAVDHGLRPESRGEAEAVVAAALGLGLAAHLEALDLAPGPGVQERARDARLAAARGVAAAGGYARIATGHTASDQAETVLFRLARGTGRSGALGMAAARDELVRPLLCVSGEETRRWCAARGIAVVRDPANDDRVHARARVRHGLVPALAAVHPGAEGHLAAFADLLRDEAEVLGPLVDAAWERARRGEGLAAAALAVEPAPLRRLLVRRLLAEAGLPGEALARAPLERALALLERGGRAELPGGGAAIEGGCLVAFTPAARAPAPAPLGVPGAVRFGDQVVRAAPGAGLPPGAARVAVRADGPLEVRGPRPGDRLPIAGGGRQAVGRLLASAGVPARLRHLVPLVATPERVVWVAGHRAADDLVVRGGGPAVVLEVSAA